MDLALILTKTSLSWEMVVFSNPSRGPLELSPAAGAQSTRAPVGLLGFLDILEFIEIYMVLQYRLLLLQ